MQRTTKIIIGIIVVIIVIAGFWYEASRKQKEEVIKIGAILTLSGNSAEYGQWALEGMQLALDEINKAGGVNGKKLAFIVENDEGDRVKAVVAAEKLINIDKVKVIIGPTRSSTAMAVAPTIESNKVIMFITIASTTDLKYAGDYIFRNRESAEINGREMANFAYSKLGLRRVALVYVNAANGVTFATAFKEHFLELGGVITNNERFEENTSDFRTILGKISKKKPEAIYVSTFLDQTALIVKQVEELNLNFKILTTSAALAPNFFEIAREAAEGVYLTSPYFDSESQDPLVSKYLADYKQRYGNDSEVFAANSYDAVKILAQAIGKVGYDVDAIRDYLYSLNDYPGISGKTSFDEYGEAIKPVIIKIAKNGQFVPYEE